MLSLMLCLWWWDLPNVIQLFSDDPLTVYIWMPDHGDLADVASLPAALGHDPPWAFVSSSPPGDESTCLTDCGEQGDDANPAAPCLLWGRAA